MELRGSPRFAIPAETVDESHSSPPFLTGQQHCGEDGLGCTSGLRVRPALGLRSDAVGHSRVCAWRLGAAEEGSEEECVGANILQPLELPQEVTGHARCLRAMPEDSPQTQSLFHANLRVRPRPPNQKCTAVFICPQGPRSAKGGSWCT